MSARTKTSASTRPDPEEYVDGIFREMHRRHPSLVIEYWDGVWTAQVELRSRLVVCQAERLTDLLNRVQCLKET